MVPVNSIAGCSHETVEMNAENRPVLAIDVTPLWLFFTLNKFRTLFIWISTTGSDGMIDKLEAAFNYHQQALGLRQERHKVLASNIANADTPNYKARDMDFAGELKKAVEHGRSSGGGLSLARTSAGHLGGQGLAPPSQGLLYRIPDQPSLDGNTVDMDRERTQFADNSVRYQAALTILNSRIQGLKSAMQPE